MIDPTPFPKSVNEAGKPEGAVTPIYTIGYGARDIDAFISILHRTNIAFLIDIRSSPYSRFKPEFSRAALEKALVQHDIRYVFMGDLLGGQPKDETCYSDGKVDYEKVKVMPFYLAGIQRLQSAFAQQERVALMCSEGKPESCHRSKLIGESLQALGIPVIHIDEKDSEKDQLEIISRLTGGQLSLFGQHEFTSRKRYHQDDESDE